MADPITRSVNLCRTASALAGSLRVDLKRNNKEVTDLTGSLPLADIKVTEALLVSYVADAEEHDLVKMTLLLDNSVFAVTKPSGERWIQQGDAPATEAPRSLLKLMLDLLCEQRKELRETAPTAIVPVVVAPPQGEPPLEETALEIYNMLLCMPQGTSADEAVSAIKLKKSLVSPSDALLDRAAQDGRDGGAHQGPRLPAGPAAPGARPRVPFKESTAVKAPKMAAAIAHSLPKQKCELVAHKGENGTIELREEKTSSQLLTIPQYLKAAAVLLQGHYADRPEEYRLFTDSFVQMADDGYLLKDLFDYEFAIRQLVEEDPRRSLNDQYPQLVLKHLLATNLRKGTQSDSVSHRSASGPPATQVNGSNKRKHPHSVPLAQPKPVVPSSNKKAKSNEECRNFKKGTCAFGANCHYKH